MKLTENQKIIMKTLLVKSNVGTTIDNYTDKHIRNLVVDELVDLYKKFKITIPKDHVRQMREIADKGK